MEIVKKSQRIEYNNATSCTAIEYPSKDKDLNGAVILLNGRYPEVGLALNNQCKLMGFVIKGSGKVVINGVENSLNEGDLVIINPLEKYYWEGEMELFMPGTPAWTPDQYVNEK